MPGYISATLQRQVRERAKFLCEYCHAWEELQYCRFHIDHVIPTSEEGANVFDNLALACIHCNRRKWNHLFYKIDTSDGTKDVPLFNPRQQQWSDHFVWSADGLTVVALTEVGQATIALLKLNDPRTVRIREEDVKVHRHPPPDDPRQKLS